MGKEPLKENTNVYFQARKRAAMSNDRLFSRENAAELLGISPYTLADYELGNTKVVPVDKVVLMADLYNAQGMLQITDEFQKQTGIADEVVDRIIEHSFRKMELVQAPPEYILLLLPDELKNYCFRCAVNALGMEHMRAKGAGANV